MCFPAALSSQPLSTMMVSGVQPACPNDVRGIVASTAKLFAASPGREITTDDERKLSPSYWYLVVQLTPRPPQVHLFWSGVWSRDGTYVMASTEPVRPKPFRLCGLRALFPHPQARDQKIRASNLFRSAGSRISRHIVTHIPMGVKGWSPLSEEFLAVVSAMYHRGELHFYTGRCAARIRCNSATAIDHLVRAARGMP